jgi:hypothetical protein
LQKIPILRLNFPRQSAREIFCLSSYFTCNLELVIFLSVVIWHFFYCFTLTSEHFWVLNLINHATLCIKVKKKYSEWIWRFEAHEGKKVKYFFANTIAQRGKKIKSSCKYPGSSKCIFLTIFTFAVIRLFLHKQVQGFSSLVWWWWFAFDQISSQPFDR